MDDLVSGSFVFDRAEGADGAISDVTFENEFGGGVVLDG